MSEASVKWKRIQEILKINETPHDAELKEIHLLLANNSDELSRVRRDIPLLKLCLANLQAWEQELSDQTSQPRGVSSIIRRVPGVILCDFFLHAMPSKSDNTPSSVETNTIKITRFFRPESLRIF